MKCYCTIAEVLGQYQAMADSDAAVAQMPFANLTVGQVFFAVVHEKTRPPLDMLDKARQDCPEDEQVMLNKYEALMTSCWAEAPADRPTFPQIVSELGTFRWESLQCSARARPSHPVHDRHTVTPHVEMLGGGPHA